MNENLYFPDLKDIMTAAHTLNEILVPIPLMKNRHLSDRLGAHIYCPLSPKGRSPSKFRQPHIGTTR